MFSMFVKSVSFHITIIIISGYDVPILNQYLDWIGVMAYDYHGQWDKKTGHVAPSYYHPEDDIPYFNLVSETLLQAYRVYYVIRRKNEILRTL